MTGAPATARIHLQIMFILVLLPVHQGSLAGFADVPLSHRPPSLLMAGGVGAGAAALRYFSTVSASIGPLNQ
jgi:hypothetical protein